MCLVDGLEPPLVNATYSTQQLRKCFQAEEPCLDTACTADTYQPSADKNERSKVINVIVYFYFLFEADHSMA